MSTPRRTTVLIDGENLDATLGMSILERRPAPEERPRWERVLDYARDQFADRGSDVNPLFFLAVSDGTMPMSFVKALMAIGFRAVPLQGAAGDKVVDIAISRTLKALADMDDDVLLGSHDADFVDDLSTLLDDDDREVGLFGFTEFVSGRLAELTARGLTILDLEHDIKAFNHPLPRVRVIDIDDFDPLAFL